MCLGWKTIFKIFIQGWRDGLALDALAEDPVQFPTPNTSLQPSPTLVPGNMMAFKAPGIHALHIHICMQTYTFFIYVHSFDLSLD